jgi:hypothetical protein
MVDVPGAQMLQLLCSKNTIHNGIETQPPNPGYTRNIANHFWDLVDGADFLLTRLGGGVVGAAS